MVLPTTDLAACYCDDADRIQSEDRTPLLCGMREALAPFSIFDMDQSVRRKVTVIFPCWCAPMAEKEDFQRYELGPGV